MALPLKKRAHPNIGAFIDSKLRTYSSQSMYHNLFYYPLLNVCLRPTLDGVERSKFLGTKLDSFDTNSILLAFDPNLHLGSPNHELSPLSSFLGLNQFIFPPKWCTIGLASICHFLVLDPHLKAVGPIYGISQ
jgi:hypothetical protein